MEHVGHVCARSSMPAEIATMEYKDLISSFPKVNLYGWTVLGNLDLRTLSALSLHSNAPLLSQRFQLGLAAPTVQFDAAATMMGVNSDESDCDEPARPETPKPDDEHTADASGSGIAQQLADLEEADQAIKKSSLVEKPSAFPSAPRGRGRGRARGRGGGAKGGRSRRMSVMGP